MRVAFDVDGVLRDLMAAYLPHVQRSRDEVVRYSSAIEFAGGLDQFLDLLDHHDCWGSAPAHPHYLGLAKMVEASGHAVVIATAITTEVGRQSTLRWLCNQDVTYDELHFCVEKLMVRFDAIIEGDPKMAYAAACAGRAAFLVNRPWTADVDVKHINLFKLPPDEEALDVVMDVLACRAQG